jgi:kinetochore protein NDC80
VMVFSEQADDLREVNHLPFQLYTFDVTSLLLQVAQREAIVSNAEIARLERDLGQARTAALSSGAGIQSRLQALQIACVSIVDRIRFLSVDGDSAMRYREQVEKVARLRDETTRAIVKNSLRDFAESGQ